MDEHRKDIMWRVKLIYLMVFLYGMAIIGRVIYIQFVEGAMWKAKAEKLAFHYINIEAMRGNVYATDGSFLATSVPIFEIRMDTRAEGITDELFSEKIDSLALGLSGLFKDRSRREYKAVLNHAYETGNRYLLLKRNVTYDQLKLVRKLPIFKLGKNKGGLIAGAVNKRVLPFGQLAFRTIGWDKEGQKNDLGIEGAFSSTLEGMSGKRLMQRLPNGMFRPLNQENEIEPQTGQDIISTIDINIQDVAEDALLRQLVLNGADHGCAILMEVKTGKIKAIANLGKNKDGTYTEKYNYAIGESTEPGSTFKLFSLLAALEDNKIKLTDSVDTHGGITRYANRTMKDSHPGSYSWLTVQRAFEKSSNVGVSLFITRAYKENPQQFIDRLYSFKANKSLSLEIDGEGVPQIKNTKNRSWSKVSLPWMSIGYEVALTPLQILAFYNAVANNGVMVRPQFIDQIRSASEIFRPYKTEIINPAIASPATIAMGRKLLEGVVLQGTGSHLRNNIYSIAGKTGTAQVASNNAGYNKSNYKGSFVGYFPADKPRYSCIVVINNPTMGDYYGGAVAAPVFKEIADKVYATDLQMGIKWPDTVPTATLPLVKAGYRNDIEQLYRTLNQHTTGSMANNGWGIPTIEGANIKLESWDPAVGIVPDVTGLCARDALFLLEKSGLRVKVSGRGSVVQQSVPAGSKIIQGSTIVLDLDIKNQQL
ncbi:MAG: penicillin-binding protein [Bacteroidales bacterium]